MIVDTDLGGDPDDAFALVAAALTVPGLALVVTSDEVGGGERARFARHLLDLCGRPDVAVVAGRRLRELAYFTVAGLIPDSVPDQPTGVVSGVEAVTEDSERVRWVGMAPLSNLADLLAARPQLARALVLTQMGGAVNYRDPTRAEHNVRLDPGAARRVLSLVPEPTLVTSDVTFTTEIEIDAKSEIYRRLAAADAPPWAQAVRAHCDQWFARHHPGSMQHDALTLSAALGLPFVEFDRRGVAFDDIGRMSVHGGGVPVRLSHRADYAAFNRWLDQALSGATFTGS